MLSYFAKRSYKKKVHPTRWLPVFVLALLWSIGPAIPVLWAGELIGHPHTDLFPSVWGLWAFVQDQPGLPKHTTLLGFPDGMGYAFSSPIKGWLAWPLLKHLGLVDTWNTLLIAARLATVLCAFGAARAWGFGARGSFAAAAIYGCAPFFQGYAVEGIVEGTDGWTLALYLWAVGAKRFRLSMLPFALTIISSWYLGMVACMLMAAAVCQDRRNLWSLGGLVIAAPVLVQFLGAFPGTAPLDETVRAAMGASLSIPSPGLRDGLNPFAITTYVGWLTLGCALYSRSRFLLLAAVPAAMSLGVGLVYELPVAELVRFPYRWHAGTLLFLAAAVAIVADEHRIGWAFGLLIVLEGLLLSPIEPVLPGTDPRIPEIVRHIDGPVLDIPGPVAMPPGEINHSRGRARYLMYEQTQHGQSSPWVPDFNSVGVVPSSRATALAAIAEIDRLVAPQEMRAVPVDQIRSLGVDYVQVHRAGLGKKRMVAVVQALENDGWAVQFTDKNRVLLKASRPTR